MIYALITIYNPTQAVVGNVKTISEQVDKVYLCDNSQLKNEELFKELINIEYIFFDKNLGLSMAFNKVLKNYTFSNDDFIIFFDQDSNIVNNHILNMKEEYNKLESEGFRIGCLAPIYFNETSNTKESPRNKQYVKENIFQVDTNITSSMLCKYKVLKDIDFWNEEVFLDFADWDLCWRFNKKGYCCFQTENVILNHSLGKGIKKVGKLHITNCAVSREYYQTRDMLYLLKKNYVPLKAKVRFILRQIFHICFLNSKRIRMKYARLGYRDFIKGVHGELN